MEKFPVTDKTRITRLPKRGVYKHEAIYAILDEALYVTLSFVREGKAFQIPVGHCRIGEYIYVHGSVGSGFMRDLAENRKEVCIGATLLDGLVLARAAFHHSVNYRSVIVFSKAERVTDPAELYLSLETFTNKIQPGRWNDIRKPDDGEWRATMVLRFHITEASAKVRSGDPKDDDDDYNLPVWAGIVPVAMERKTPVPDSRLAGNIPLPEYLKT